MSLKRDQAPRRTDSIKRTIVVLLTGGTILYGFILGAVYLRSSGFELSKFLKNAVSPEPEEASSLLPEGESLEKTGAAHTLPRLDDIPLDVPPFDAPQAPFESASTPSAETNDDPLPPPPTVPGVVMLSRMTPIKCWDNRGFEQSAADCDALNALARRTEENLTLLENCRTEILGAGAMGVLALYAEADFVRNRMTFWPGTASTLRYADRVAECLTERWREPRFSKLPHRFDRYRMKAAVRFEGSYHAAPAPPGTVAVHSVITASQAERLETAAENAVEVTVARDRVRVRKAPVDGEIIGFISTGQRVKLLQVTDEWCSVKTKRGNVGWMVCWGLDLQPNKDTDATAPSQEAKKNQ